MLTVNISIQGDKELTAKLKKAKGELEDWQQELHQVTDYLHSFYQNNIYETEGGAFGLRWQSLKSSYEAKKRNEYPGRGILERTGAMRRSLTEDVTRTYADIGYPKGSTAQYHQFGTRFMPQRQLINVDNTLKNKIIDILKEGLIVKLRKSFR